MKQQVIYLEPHDDILSARDKLSWASSERVLLVLPPITPESPFCSRVGIVLLKREANRLRKQLAIITENVIVREHCAAQAIACFSTVELSRNHLLPVQESAQGLPERVTLAPRQQKAARPGRADNRKLQPLLRGPIGQLRVLGLSAALIALVLVIVPSAKVTISRTRNGDRISTNIVADPSANQVNLKNGVIPARFVSDEVDATSSVPTTGQTQAPTSQSRGRVVVTNLAPVQISVPAGTLFTSSKVADVRFATLADATVPGRTGESVAIEIEAVVPGIESNLPTNTIDTFEGPLAGQLSVTNPEPTTGGEGIEVPAIANDDVERVRALVVQQLFQQAYAQFQSDPYVKLLSSEFIPVETLQISTIQSEVYSGNVGQQGATLTLQIRAVVQGTAIDERGARQVAFQNWHAKRGTNLPGDISSLLFERGPVSRIDSVGRITFVIVTTGKSSATPDIADIQNLVQAKPVAEAHAMLVERLGEFSNPRIVVWPSFWPVTPLLSARIDVRIEDGE